MEIRLAGNLMKHIILKGLINKLSINSCSQNLGNLDEFTLIFTKKLYLSREDSACFDL